MATALATVGTDSQNSFEDLSGISPVSTNGLIFGAFKSDKAGSALSSGNSSTSTLTDEESSNPYNILISLCDSDPARISQAYSTHRTTRNAKFSKKLRSEETSGPTVDRTLVGVLKAKAEDVPVDDAIDPRNCLVFWARPPERVKGFILSVQEQLRSLAPEGLWLMPPDCLHMTVLEISHSVSPAEVQKLEDQILSSISDILEITLQNKAKLVQPQISFDAAALALSFIPSPGAEDTYTYHHLRRDLYKLCNEAGVPVQSRYVLPSAHITLGRFIDDAPLKGRMADWVEGLEKINEQLRDAAENTSWHVGEEYGLDLRRGRLWYGGGSTVVQGKGF